MRDRVDHALTADEELMPLVAGGDAAAFEVVYRRHATPAYSLAFRMTGAQSPAEDVVQEAFLALWRSAARYDPRRGSVRSWVLGIVHNRGVDALRRHAVRDRGRIGDEGLEERIAGAERTDDEALRRHEAGIVRGSLTALPSDQARAIELAYFGGFSHVEIADVLKLPLGTVKGRIRLGLEKLREGIGDNVEVPR